MAKGFTVKAKAPAPTDQEPTWDYDLAKEMIKGKTVVFCLPGRGVSYTYLKNFVQLCFDASVLVQMCCVDRIRFPGMAS